MAAGDPERLAALAAATTFVSSWNGSKGSGNVVTCAQMFEHYLKTGRHMTREELQDVQNQEKEQKG